MRPGKLEILDIDDTFCAAHGGQQLAFWNAHHDERGFAPMHIYHVASGTPVVAILRPARTAKGTEVRCVILDALMAETADNLRFHHAASNEAKLRTYLKRAAENIFRIRSGRCSTRSAYAPCGSKLIRSGIFSGRAMRSAPGATGRGWGTSISRTAYGTASALPVIPSLNDGLRLRAHGTIGRLPLRVYTNVESARPDPHGGIIGRDGLQSKPRRRRRASPLKRDGK